MSGGKKMRFVKGLVIGGLITTGALMMWSDNNSVVKNMTKKGKKYARKMGII